LNPTDAEKPESVLQEEEKVRRLLSTYEIGAKLRELRAKKKIALIDLGRHTGLSASMLSQLENSKLIPTLPTLVRIAMAFDVDIEYFFHDRRQQRPFTLMRKEERVKFPDEADNRAPNYFFECMPFPSAEKPVRVYLAEFSRVAEEDVKEHSHDGTEFLYVIEGSMAIRYQRESHTLHAGDSVHFDSSSQHGYRALSEPPARAIVVIMATRC